MGLISSIDISLCEHVREQGGIISSSEHSDHLGNFEWKDTPEGYLFWHILHTSYSLYGVYDYTTIIKLFIDLDIRAFEEVLYLFQLYKSYFNKETGTLTSKGYEILHKKINYEINN